MNGKFELVHSIDKDLVELGYKTFNPTTVELTRLCLEYKKKPEEVVNIFKEVRKLLL